MKKFFILLTLLALTLSALNCGGGAGSSNSPAGENPGKPSIVQLLPSHFIAQTNTVITLHAKVLDGNGNPVRHLAVRFTNLSPIGVLSSTSAKTNDIGIATVTLKSTVQGFATIQAEVNKGVAIVRDRKTVFFATTLNLQPFMTLDVDGDNDGIYNEPSDLTLFENANDNQVVVRATVFNRFGQRAALTSVTFGADSSEASFPLGSTGTTNANGEATVLVQVDPAAVRNLGTILNITATADNGAANLVSLFLLPVIVNNVNVTANPSVIEPEDTSDITASVVLNTGGPAPDGTSVSYIASCGSVTPFAQTANGVANAEYTGPSSEGTCTITATSGGVSATTDILVTTALTVLPGAQTIDGIAGGTVSYTIYSGVAPYTVTSSNAAIAYDSAPGDGTWNVAASGDSFIVTVPAFTSAGTVTLTVRDAAGTTKTATLTITVPTSTLSITPTSFAIGNAIPFDVDVQYFVSGGVAPYTVYYTLLTFIDQSITANGAQVGTAGTNQAVFTVRFTGFTGWTATFDIIVVDSLGQSVNSTVDIQ